MQIQTIKRYPQTPVRIAIINKSTNDKCWKECEKRKPSFTVGGTANWYSHCGKQYGGSSKKLKIELSYDPAIPLIQRNPKR